MSCERILYLVVISLLLTILLVQHEFYTQWIIRDFKPKQLPSQPSGTGSIRQPGTGVIGGFSNYTLTLLRSRTRNNHIAFLKVHKAASSTVQNILYRFGFERDLSFALPFKGHYISRNANSYAPLLAPFDGKTGKYDIICNHVVFNNSKFKSLMYNDAFYVAIVREPLSRFISAAYYYTYVYPNPYLQKLNENTMVHDLIMHPEIFEPKDLQQSRTFNHMALDFGLGMNSLEVIQNLDEARMNDFVSGLVEVFDFVMIVEKFDESLVMLKRYLGWSIKDILYIPRNTFEGKPSDGVEIQNITDIEKETFKKTNHLDYLIYERFLTRFLILMSEEENLEAEVKEFKWKLKLVEAFCIMDNTREEAVFWETPFDEGFRVNRHDCEQMMLSELSFCQKLQDKHKQYLQHR